MAVLSFEMIEEIRGVAEAYSRHERERQARVGDVHAKREEERAQVERRAVQQADG